MRTVINEVEGHVVGSPSPSAFDYNPAATQVSLLSGYHVSTLFSFVKIFASSLLLQPKKKLLLCICRTIMIGKLILSETLLLP